MEVRFGNYLGQYPGTILCHKCGKRGIMAGDLVETPEGPKRESVALSGDFYERLCKQPPHAVEHVCNGCGAAQRNVAAQPATKV